MKLCKYYSLDECHNLDLIFQELDVLEMDSKIEYEYLNDDDVVKIKNTGMNAKEVKELLSFFKDNDVIDYPDYEEYDEDDDYEDEDEESYGDEEDY